MGLEDIFGKDTEGVEITAYATSLDKPLCVLGYYSEISPDAALAALREYFNVVKVSSDRVYHSLRLMQYLMTNSKTADFGLYLYLIDEDITDILKDNIDMIANTKPLYKSVPQGFYANRKAWKNTPDITPDNARTHIVLDSNAEEIAGGVKAELIGRKYNMRFNAETAALDILPEEAETR